MEDVVQSAADPADGIKTVCVKAADDTAIGRSTADPDCDLEVSTKTQSKKSCKVCAEEINLLALKCTECGSYQNWRSRIDFSSNILSLLVALIAVLTAAVPVLRNELLARNSKIQLIFTGMTFQNHLRFFVTNGGVRPGAIIGASLQIPGQASFTLAPVVQIPSQAFVTIGPTLIQPGAANMVDFQIGDVPNLLAKLPLPTSCSIIVSSTDYLGQRYNSNIVISDCAAIGHVLKNLAETRFPR